MKFDDTPSVHISNESRETSRRRQGGACADCDILDCEFRPFLPPMLNMGLKCGPGAKLNLRRAQKPEDLAVELQGRLLVENSVALCLKTR